MTFKKYSQDPKQGIMLDVSYFPPDENNDVETKFFDLNKWTINNIIEEEMMMNNTANNSVRNSEIVEVNEKPQNSKIVGRTSKSAKMRVTVGMTDKDFCFVCGEDDYEDNNQIVYCD